MTARTRTMTLLIIVGFVAFLLWSTLASQHVQCSVAVEFQGRQGMATASGGSEEDAIREAQTTACGPLTASMNDRIACGRAAPASRHCKTI